MQLRLAEPFGYDLVATLRRVFDVSEPQHRVSIELASSNHRVRIVKLVTREKVIKELSLRLYTQERAWPLHCGTTSK